MLRGPHVLPLAWGALLAGAGVVAVRAAEGLFLLQHRDGTPAGELVVSPRPVRLLREGHEPLAAGAAVQVGDRLYALYGTPREAGEQRESDEPLLGVYRLSEGARATEERVVRVGQDGQAPLRPQAASLQALVGQLQELVGCPEVAVDLAALRERGAELALEVLLLDPMQVDHAEAVLSVRSRTRLALQPLDSASALALFRLGALRDPPASCVGVRALADLLRREIVPRRFVRTHLLTGAGRVAARTFGGEDELETWILLAETRGGALLTVRVEWRVVAAD